MIDQKHATAAPNTVAKVVDRLFGRSSSAVPSQPTGELARYGEIIQRVREVMLRHVIEPNPAN
ncbi:MAG: hypothetical protein IPP45_16185 [Sphingomonadales bacterium]|nr:hypothetical protein [Sphingomonadales bacterium]